jgi:hypothetical protein
VRDTTPPVLSSAAALLDGLFEHPARDLLGTPNVLNNVALVSTRNFELLSTRKVYLVQTFEVTNF